MASQKSQRSLSHDLDKWKLNLNHLPRSPAIHAVSNINLSSDQQRIKSNQKFKERFSPLVENKNEIPKFKSSLYESWKLSKDSPYKFELNNCRSNKIETRNERKHEFKPRVLSSFKKESFDENKLSLFETKFLTSISNKKNLQSSLSPDFYQREYNRKEIRSILKGRWGNEYYPREKKKNYSETKESKLESYSGIYIKDPRVKEYQQKLELFAKDLKSTKAIDLNVINSFITPKSENYSKLNSFNKKNSIKSSKNKEQEKNKNHDPKITLEYEMKKYDRKKSSKSNESYKDFFSELNVRPSVSNISKGNSRTFDEKAFFNPLKTTKQDNIQRASLKSSFKEKEMEGRFTIEPKQIDNLVVSEENEFISRISTLKTKISNISNCEKFKEIAENLPKKDLEKNDENLIEIQPKERISLIKDDQKKYITGFNENLKLEKNYDNYRMTFNSHENFQKNNELEVTRNEEVDFQKKLEKIDKEEIRFEQKAETKVENIQNYESSSKARISAFYESRKSQNYVEDKKHSLQKNIESDIPVEIEKNTFGINISAENSNGIISERNDLVKNTRPSANPSYTQSDINEDIFQNRKKEDSNEKDFDDKNSELFKKPLQYLIFTIENKFKREKRKAWKDFNSILVSSTLYIQGINRLEKFFNLITKRRLYRAFIKISDVQSYPKNFKKKAINYKLAFPLLNSIKSVFSKEKYYFASKLLRNMNNISTQQNQKILKVKRGSARAMRLSLIKFEARLKKIAYLRLKKVYLENKLQNEEKLKESENFRTSTISIAAQIASQRSNSNDIKYLEDPRLIFLNPDKEKLKFESPSQNKTVNVDWNRLSKPKSAHKEDFSKYCSVSKYATEKISEFNSSVKKKRNQSSPQPKSGKKIKDRNEIKILKLKSEILFNRIFNIYRKRVSSFFEELKRKSRNTNKAYKSYGKILFNLLVKVFRRNKNEVYADILKHSFKLSQRRRDYSEEKFSETIKEDQEEDSLYSPIDKLKNFRSENLNERFYQEARRKRKESNSEDNSRDQQILENLKEIQKELSNMEKQPEQFKREIRKGNLIEAKASPIKGNMDLAENSEMSYSEPLEITDLYGALKTPGKSNIGISIMDNVNSAGKLSRKLKIPIPKFDISNHLRDNKSRAELAKSYAEERKKSINSMKVKGKSKRKKSSNQSFASIKNNTVVNVRNCESYSQRHTLKKVIESQKRAISQKFKTQNSTNAMFSPSRI